MGKSTPKGVAARPMAENLYCFLHGGRGVRETRGHKHGSRTDNGLSLYLTLGLCVRDAVHIMATGGSKTQTRKVHASLITGIAFPCTYCMLGMMLKQRLPALFDKHFYSTALCKYLPFILKCIINDLLKSAWNVGRCFTINGHMFDMGQKQAQSCLPHSFVFPFKSLPYD